ncbi:hypothetical protein OHA18_33170 [Kribbella sp. NBC_00709]|nr:hypothetical protein [Kribbella sp. NBC_00709]
MSEWHGVPAATVDPKAPEARPDEAGSPESEGEAPPVRIPAADE